VTRLGELFFLPLERLITLGSILKIKEVAQFFARFFTLGSM
jgi:hypothetical protein